MDKVAVAVKELVADVSKHTPGDWIVDVPNDGRASILIRTARPLVEGATMPAKIAKLDRSRRCKRLMADARLLAAAPDLLELVVYVRHLITPDAPIAKRIDAVLKRMEITLPAEQPREGGVS